MGRGTPALSSVVPEPDGHELALLARLATDLAAGEDDPSRALEAVVAELHARVPGLLPSVFVLERGRLWLVAQHGYAVVPDGIPVETGITGRAVRLGRAQLVRDVHADPDYVPALPSVVSELALPLVAHGKVVGLLNLESERVLPREASGAFDELAPVLASVLERLERARTLDLSALARLFAHMGGIRDPAEIAALGAAALPRVLPLATGQVLLWQDDGGVEELASWSVDDERSPALGDDELSALREAVEPSVVCRLLPGPDDAGHVAWLPLRANGQEIGALVGTGSSPVVVDPARLDTAAVLAAHLAASLDAAVVLQRERESAVTDLLTGVLNRRGLEELLEGELAAAGERRAPLSLLVFDCDDLKEVNDRAGHEFGDALLREVATVLVRCLPPGASAARLGGDEFVVVLPEADTELATALGHRIREVLAEGLTDAGFPLRVSAGVSSYPFDGARPSVLLRAADQALYAAKNTGKDRISSYQDVLRGSQSRQGDDPSLGRRGRRPTSDGSILREAVAAAEAIESEQACEEVCNRLCKALVFVVGATGCSVSRVDGEFLVDVGSHALRDIELAHATAFRVGDFPLTAEVLDRGEPRAVSFADGDVDPAEAFVLRDLGMNAVLMLPLRVQGVSWGLVELYEMRLRRFTDDDVAVARFLVREAERRLGVVGTDAPRRPRRAVYVLPSPDDSPRGPRTR